MPKSSSNLVSTVTNNNAVRNAPTQSARKSLCGFEINFLSIDGIFFAITVGYL